MMLVILVTNYTVGIVFRLKKACKTILNVCISIEADLIHISVSEGEEKWKTHGWLGEKLSAGKKKKQLIALQIRWKG